MRFVPLALLTLLGLVPFAAAPAQSLDVLSIRVQPGDWGNASVRDIQTVLTSVAEVLSPYFPRHATSRVVVGFSTSGPRVLASRSADGAHQVLLNVQDRRWDQFAYQFSHELCHIFTNHDQRPIGGDPASRPHQWFEETLCEAVSLLALKRLALSWSSSPPHTGWDAYAPAFGEYAERLQRAEHRRLPPHQSLSAWYGEHQSAMESNPYLRDENEVLAGSLLELFESTPGSLEAIAYLNVEAPSQPGFEGYLAAWYDCCPDQGRLFVRRVTALFGKA